MGESREIEIVEAGDLAYQCRRPTSLRRRRRRRGNKIHRARHPNCVELEPLARLPACGVAGDFSPMVRK